MENNLPNSFLASIFLWVVLYPAICVDLFERKAAGSPSKQKRLPVRFPRKVGPAALDSHRLDNTHSDWLPLSTSPYWIEWLSRPSPVIGPLNAPLIIHKVMWRNKLGIKYRRRVQTMENGAQYCSKALERPFNWFLFLRLRRERGVWTICFCINDLLNMCLFRNYFNSLTLHIYTEWF